MDLLLFYQFPVDYFQLLIKVLAIDPDNSIFKESENGNPLFLSQDTCRFTNAPLVIVQCDALLKFSNPDWVKMAGDRLSE